MRLIIKMNQGTEWVNIKTGLILQDENHPIETFYLIKPIAIYRFVQKVGKSSYFHPSLLKLAFFV